MNVNSTLEKKLLKYSAMASGVLAIGASANAQITYYDENPDVVVTGHQDGAAFDFDGDTNLDILIFTLDGTAAGTFVSSSVTYNYTIDYVAGGVYAYTGAAVLEGTEVVDLIVNGSQTFTNTMTNADMLNAGDAINSAGVWATGQNGMATVQATAFTPAFAGFVNNVNWQNQWVGAVDKYIGIRFTSAGNLHYGWMRLTVAADATSVTIKDWAFNTVADGAINAGQTSVGIDANVDELALVRFYDNRLDVKTVNGTAGNLTIVNMEGKVVYNKGINNSFESIDLSNLAGGLYIVNAEFAEGSVQHKVVVR